MLTCFTALGDESAQGLAHSDPQVWALINGCAQCPGQAFEGGSYICGPCAESRQKGPDLGGRNLEIKVSPVTSAPARPVPLPFPAALTCHWSVS